MKVSVFVFCLSLLLVGVAPAADSLKVRTVGHCDTPGTANGVVASGDSAYVAADTSGLRIISVVDPAHPVEVGHYDTPGEAWGVAVSGHFAYVADGDSGFRVVSVANPAHPVQVGHCATSGYAEGVAVSGKCAYVADGDSGLRVITIADSAHPAQIGHCATPAFAYGVTVSLDSAYVADGESGLRIISVTDSAHPAQVGYYDTPGFANGVALSRDYVLVADFDAGLGVYHSYVPGIQEAPSAVSWAARYAPTIVRGVLLLEEAPSHRPQAVSLLDASGRKVLDLRAGANDVSGLGPGVYFVCDGAQGQAQAAQKVVIAR